MGFGSQGGAAWDATFQDVTASRAFNTTYQNTTSQFMVVNITGGVTLNVPGHAYLSCYIGSGSPPSNLVARTGLNLLGDILFTLTFIVPPGWYYRTYVDETAPFMVGLTTWVEWTG